MKPVVKEKGIKAGPFVLAIVAVSLALIALSLLVLPYESVLKVMNHIPDFLLNLFVRVGLFMGLGLLYNFVFYTQVLDAPLWHFGGHLRAKNNNSQIIMFVCLFAAAAFPIAFAGGTNLNEWLFLMLFKSAIAHILSIAVQLLLAGSVGVRTLDKFKEWIDMEGNDSHAVFSGGMYALITLIVSVIPLVIG